MRERRIQVILHGGSQALWLHASLSSFHSEQGSDPDAVSKFSYYIHGLYVAV